MHYLICLLFLVTSWAACMKCHHHHHHHHSPHDHHEDSDTKPPVTVSESGEFRGGYNVTRHGRRFETYRGIRYAEPPLGELRFQPPVLITKYKEPVDASEDGPACPLPASPDYYVDEDCLTINVYTPLKKNRSKPLPVIFFIHAGGFYVMTGRSDLAGPHYLLDRDVVLVTINYRLGSLGFLSTGDALAPGNNGLKDQVAALKWVQRNIASFGGDPDNVTIAGCSAGSFSVLLHMVSPMSKGLFHKGISMSGSPIDKAPLKENLYDLAVKQAQLLNCPTDNSKVIIDCLKTKHWKELGDSLLGFYEFGFDPVLIWSPVVEKDFGQEKFLQVQPVDAVRDGHIQAVPYIVSQTKDEFFWMAFNPLQNETLRSKMNTDWESVAPISFQLPRDNLTYARYAARRLRTQYLHDKPLANDAESAANLGLLYADAIESLPVHRLANLMCRHSPHPVWYYEFTYIGAHSHYEDPVTKKPVGASHHDDLIYLFTLSYRFPSITDGPDGDAVDRLTAIWYNFARYGDPNPRDDTPELQGLNWPAMTPQKRTYLDFGKQLAIKENMKEERIPIWEELYPMRY
ncbi:antennal esterase CXE5 [Danaus plexippus plexippus]|uniref:Carboxylic ester hydrolase n=1 Tax=Danaus plexippus plexippus TaxID=278856 RepID=A0A212EM26_DANPL|nr:antennal esterase CXE5 [Danaus plexippus plexippus]